MASKAYACTMAQMPPATAILVRISLRSYRNATATSAPPIGLNKAGVKKAIPHNPAACLILMYLLLDLIDDFRGRFHCLWIQSPAKTNTVTEIIMPSHEHTMISMG